MLELTRSWTSRELHGGNGYARSAITMGGLLISCKVDHIAKTYQEVISKNTVVASGAVRLEFSEKKGYHLSFPRSAK